MVDSRKLRRCSAVTLGKPSRRVLGLEHRLEPWLERGLRLFRGRARLEAREHMHPHSASIEQTVPAGARSAPPARSSWPGSTAPARHRRSTPREARRRDPDDRHRIVVDENVAPDDVLVAAEIVSASSCTRAPPPDGRPAEDRPTRSISRPSSGRTPSTEKIRTRHDRRHEPDRAAAPIEKVTVVGWRQKTPSKNCS